ncbi:glutamate 5-kinase [Bacillus mesophilus]|uniref:Glutamate 5-kinase n=1 Tax=Bacillus mesophilus TaxID=1808955 RepID=A0A6M0Q814_9BACI|nr:glutamate 5-kinase [Bacillus mesophilus]MBM7662146.1 glutamate 5-kinase [Bacillus mesophilus]NEY72501.1 glutamate 5-kinase [Bacillus mesophilus]
MGKKRIVVKIGSSSLTNDGGEIDQKKLEDHVSAIATLRNEGHEVLLVSSGAVAAGFRGLGYPTRPTTLKGKQAAAAVGQGLLMRNYYEQLNLFGILPAQVLLTRSDFSNRVRYQNAYSTLVELLDRGILPIINENDTVSVEELTFGDNDMLSALVSGLVHADELIILTDINGIYDCNPRTNPFAKRWDHLDDIKEEILIAAEGSGSKVGTGGMRSKILAAKTALTLGVPSFVGQGIGPLKLSTILAGNGDGTYIVSQQLYSINTKRQWIAFHSEVAGRIFIDPGAEDALLFNGKSLLSAGVYGVEGNFQKGDVVEVFGSGSMLGKGEVSCSSEEIKVSIANRGIDRKKFGEIIHRDKWVKI